MPSIVSTVMMLNHRAHSVMTMAPKHVRRSLSLEYWIHSAVASMMPSTANMFSHGWSLSIASTENAIRAMPPAIHAVLND